MKRHPMMINYLEEIQQTLKNPVKIIAYSLDRDVKYLNGEGFVVSSFFDKKIK